MTKEEAIQCLREGKRLTHTHFMSDEYVYLIDGKIHDERNISIDGDFWKYRMAPHYDQGWSVFETKTESSQGIMEQLIEARERITHNEAMIKGLNDQITELKNMNR